MSAVLLAGCAAVFALGGAFASPVQGLNLGAAALCAIVAARLALIRIEEPRSADETAGVSPGAASPDIPASQEALEAMSDPTLIVGASEPDDLAGRRILFANSAAQSLLRIQKEGALLLSAIRRPEVLEGIDTALFGAVRSDVSYDTGGAQNRYWRVTASPLPTRGAMRLALIVMRDETDIRRSERMRADFMANASHELRTPLASLTGFIETLRGHARDDEAARERFLSIMSVQADRMARLIDDLMSLTRIESNEHIRPDGDCDLTSAAQDITEALADLAARKGVSVRFEAPHDRAVRVMGDRDQIMQVIQNLVDNGLKYSPPGAELVVRLRTDLGLDAASASDPASPRLADSQGGRLSIVVPDRDESLNYHRVDVIDQGPGMDRRHLPRLAERFYRVEGQKSGERLGTGLGLAIVKHIVNRHRGGLWVESAPGGGSLFSVYFPVTRLGERQTPPTPVTKP